MKLILQSILSEKYYYTKDIEKLLSEILYYLQASLVIIIN